MHQAFKKLIRGKNLSEDSVDRFIKTHKFPLVSPSGATFVYRGKADQVHLQHWVAGLPSSQPFQRVEGHDLWYFFLQLPPRSRIEYKFNLIIAGTGKWIRDPLNSVQAHDPFGANSVCRSYGYRQPDWTKVHRDVRPGRIERTSLRSSAFGERRALRIYFPARYRETHRYPLLIVHDGDDYLRYAGFKTVLDNLIHRLEIDPTIVAFTQSPRRLTEYAGDKCHARFLAKDLVPFLQKRLPIIDDPSARGSMGASFGAVASLHAAWTYQDLFGQLLLQSGSFAFTDIGIHQGGAVLDPVVRFVNAFRRKPGQPAERIFVSCGTYEPLIYENRSMVPFMREHGLEVRYREARDGHNWENWRDRQRDGLSWLFPGPLWMVYE